MIRSPRIDSDFFRLRNPPPPVAPQNVEWCCIWDSVQSVEQPWAEIARLDRRDADAMRLYEQAIRSAHDHGFVQNEGLAFEAAARFYNARGVDSIAHVYLRNARYCYLRWGAKGKVRQLEQLHPHLREHPAAQASPTPAIGAPAEQLDVGAVIK